MDSNLSVDEYCSQSGISRHAYYYWLRILRETEIDKSTIKNEIVELNQEVTENKTAMLCAGEPYVTDDSLILETKGIRIIVNGNTSPALLSKTLEVLRHA